MSELKLLPCPFCGGEAAVRDIKEPAGFGWVGCQRCRCFIDFVNNGKPLAIAAWNSRTGKDINVATNADRIRSMTDEDLSAWLVDETVCERVCKMDEYCHGNECVERVTRWLKQPAKEEHNETDRC